MSMELNLLQSLFWQGRCQSDVLFIQEMISCFPFQKRRDTLKKKSTGITFGTDPVWPNHFWLTKCFILRIFIAILTVLGLEQRVLTLRLSDRRPVPVQGAPSLSLARSGPPSLPFVPLLKKRKAGAAFFLWRIKNWRCNWSSVSRLAVAVTNGFPRQEWTRNFVKSDLFCAHG